MNKLIGLYYRSKAYVRQKQISKCGNASVYSMRLKKYGTYRVLSANDSNMLMSQKIKSGEPFLAGRFGSTELLNMRSYDFGGMIGQKYDSDFHFNHLCEWSGFFPQKKELLPDFVAVLKSACQQVDLLAVWYQPFEDYYMRFYMPQLKNVTYLLDFEQWSERNAHWSAALRGKKVLVIHPFVDTIVKQYTKREKLFPNTDILPDFELHTIKAVQTLAGTCDPRFSTWFEALEWMFEETKKIDFDIAIVGCGAYGLPLAAKIKQMGKQAIHLAGATQVLFGIKGKRWEENSEFSYVRKLFNEHWVYPGEEERLRNGDNVEGGCYWG